MLTAILSLLTKAASRPQLTELQWFTQPGASSASSAFATPLQPLPQPDLHTVAAPTFDPLVPASTAAFLTSLGPRASGPPMPRLPPSLETPTATASGFRPATTGAGMRAVRLTGLRGLPLVEGSAALTASLGVMLFLTLEDTSRGSAFAQISSAMWDTLFGNGHSSRIYEHGHHEVTIESRRNNGDLHSLPPGSILNTPPDDRKKTAARSLPGPQPPQQRRRLNPKAVSAPRTVSRPPARFDPPPPSALVARRAVEANPVDRRLTE